MELRYRALAALQAADPADKLARVGALTVDLTALDTELSNAGQPDTAHTNALTQSIACGDIPEHAGLPGRPALPLLVAPADVPLRSPFTLEGRAALVHAICHIEFNAINLALDAVWRFAGMPHAFYRDWTRVAVEEAQHFTLLHDHLQTLGHRYGDFPAHDGLWEMCEKTKHDIVARMALVPRTLEARGLDATPLIQARLRKVGTADALQFCALLDIIVRDEIGHVAIGNHWYRWLCARDGLDPLAHNAILVRRHSAPRLRPPFNEAARRAAGFTEDEMRWLLEA